MQDRAVAAEIRRGLRAAADPAKAPGMQAYMKSDLPYYGVPVPATRRVVRAVAAATPLPDRATWQDTVLALWEGATHREERPVGG